MNSIYLIIRYDFDRMENHYSEARLQKILGYARSEAEGQAIIEVLKLKTPSFYQGWDKETYPKWELDEVKPIVTAT